MVSRCQLWLLVGITCGDVKIIDPESSLLSGTSLDDLGYSLVVFVHTKD